MSYLTIFEGWLFGFSIWKLTFKGFFDLGLQVSANCYGTRCRGSKHYVYDKLAKCLEGNGYRSATEYIIYLIRKKLPDLESEDVERRLKALGYT